MFSKCIPVGCVPPARNHAGLFPTELLLWTGNPPGQRHPGQRPLAQRPEQRHLPLQRPPGKKTP